MSKIPFRDFHLLEILYTYDEQNLPLDLFISNYYRAHKALGPKDRGYIAETVYGLIRWQGLLDYLDKKKMGHWEERLRLLQENDMEKLSLDPSIPIPERISFPKELFDVISGTHGEDKASELCRISNFPAPTTIRINPLKTTRDALMSQWKDVYSISPCQHSSLGIIFHKKTNFFSLPEFKAGLFEVQDEGSQLLARLVEAAPGQQVMDYCSGSGGKTLAFAPAMQNKGQIFLHDVRPHALLECKKRLKRAGIQNAQIIQSDEDPKLKKLKKKMDWVLVDVPCSGTGTLRRNPDMKWKFEKKMLQRLVGLQRQIFEKALSFLHPEGKIVYATCSILKEENHEQLQHFLQTYDLILEKDPFQCLPEPEKMDGFFGAVLKHK